MENGTTGNSMATPSRQRLDVLSRVCSELTQPLSLDELFRAIYRAVDQILDAAGFILGLYDATSQTIEVVKQVDSGVELPGGSFPIGRGFTSQVIRTVQPILKRHWSSEGPRVTIQYATDQRGLPESGITVPLLIGPRVIGVMSVQSYRPEAYDDEDLLALQILGSQAALAVENLRQAAQLDAQLQRRVSDLEAILANMAEALLIVDQGGRIVRLNRAARELLALEDTSVVLGQPLDRDQYGQWPLGAREIAEALAPTRRLKVTRS